LEVSGISSSFVKEQLSNLVEAPSVRLDFLILGPNSLCGRVRQSRWSSTAAQKSLDQDTHQAAEAEICDNEFVDSGQQVCGK
jgi:hypothetical protein